MIIRKLQASFGKLQNDSLRLHDGLNVIYGIDRVRKVVD